MATRRSKPQAGRKAPTLGKPPPLKRVQHPVERRDGRSRRWIGVVVLVPVAVAAAAAAFLLGKSDAEGPREVAKTPAAGLPNTPDYHSLLVDPRSADRVLLGTHVGVYESTSGGRTWSFMTLDGNDAMNLASVETGTVWAAGHNVLARSDDGAATWTDVRPQGLPSLDVHGFAQDPGEPLRLYAAVAGEGLFRSDDGGRTFVLASDVVGPSVFGLAVDADGRVLAADPQRGLLASSDGGSRWEPLFEQQNTIGVAVHPVDTQRILVTGPGVVLSTDGGRSWDQVLEVPEGAGPVAWSPSDPERAYAVGFDRSLYRTDDRGVTWRPVS